MKIYDDHPYIYIQATKERIPVTQEEFDVYYKETSVYRRRQQRYGLCACPQKHWFSCDTDCENCRFRIANNNPSLDAPRFESEDNNDGMPASMYDELLDDGPTLAELVADADQVRHLLNQIRELMPEAIHVGEMRLNGLSDAVIADVIGIPRTTLLYRLKKLRQVLDYEVSEVL